MYGIFGYLSFTASATVNLEIGGQDGANKFCDSEYLPVREDSVKF